MTELIYRGHAAANFVIMSHSLRIKDIIFVEGLSDKKLFMKLFPENMVPVPADGAENVVAALDVIKEFNKIKEDKDKIRAIAFIDQDYLHLSSGDFKNIEGLFLSQYRDIEIDMLHTKSMHYVLNEYGNSEKIDKFGNILRFVMQNLEIISYLRAYNFVYNKNWNFKDVNLVRYVDIEGQVDQEKFLSFFKQKNSVISDEFKNFIIWKNNNTINLELITRGHDACCVIGQMLRKILGNADREKVVCDAIESSLRLAIRPDFCFDFLWYRSIKEWCEMSRGGEGI
ncbi:MAG: DUF4435 domain-containing protein [Magnetococcales bacterium]|nr:DUF4435 domain-containing protein [Magnetococcales bacterium]